MWRRRMTQHSPVTARLTTTSQHRGETRKSRFNRFMSLKGAKSPSIVPKTWVYILSL